MPKRTIMRSYNIDGWSVVGVPYTVHRCFKGGLSLEKRTHDEALLDIRVHPEQHRHDFDGLQMCCMIDGAIDVSLMDAHVGLAGPGQRCDVKEGPCACGGWHSPDLFGTL